MGETNEKGASKMILKFCQKCEHHSAKMEDSEHMSHCANENMWSIYTKCLSKVALDEFIERQKVRQPKRHKGK